MSVDDVFAPSSEDDVLRLVREHPLAWVVSAADTEFRATLLPLRPQTAAEGRLTHLVGHFARSNPQVQLLQRSTRAHFLFLGAHGYISPSWMADRTQAPTWNYASAQLSADVVFFEDAAQIEEHLRDLAAATEAQRPAAWSIDEMGPRLARLARRVIGFRATVREVRAKFKLGQDERDDVYLDIAAGLQRTGQPALLDWMQHFNPGRRSPCPISKTEPRPRPKSTRRQS